MFRLVICKPVIINGEDFTGIYSVSNYGSIRNHNNKLLKPSMHRDGYIKCILYKNGKRYTYQLHRIVAEAFIPNPDNLPQVNHKDENKQNNFVYVNGDGSVDPEKSNLEWCTAKYNMNYGTGRKRCGDKLKNYKDFSRSINMFDLNNNFIKKFPSIREAERELGLKQFSSIHKFFKHKDNIAYGYKWQWDINN